MDSSRISAEDEANNVSDLESGNVSDLACPNYDRQHRVPQLDFLRGIAILLVIFCHPLVGLPLVSRWEAILFYPFAYVGWMGVDLFFVLSGFLISGLIFNEYKKTGNFRPVRFLIRRAFKIWPGYYVFLLVTLPLLAKGNVPMRAPNLLADFLYLQNYIGPTFWVHTWSLAVEEHFYICLSLILYVLLGRLRKSGAVPYVCLVAMVLPVIFRLIKIQSGDFDIGQTHLRCDALAFGVLIGYAYKFLPERLESFTKPKKCALLGILLICLGVAFHPKMHWFGFVFGLTFVYLGWGLVLAHLMHCVWPKNMILKTIGVIGVYSYSIYIWLPFVSYTVEICRILLAQSGIRLSMFPQVCLCVPLTIYLGIAMAKLVEFPMLRLRDRVFPPTAARTSMPS